MKQLFAGFYLQRERRCDLQHAWTSDDIRCHEDLEQKNRLRSTRAKASDVQKRFGWFHQVSRKLVAGWHRRCWTHGTQGSPGNHSVPC